MLDFAIALQNFAKSKILRNDRRLSIKFGISQGPIVSSIIGEFNPQYSLFGETLNLAKEACQESSSGKILVTMSAKETLYRFSNNLVLIKTSITVGQQKESVFVARKKRIKPKNAAKRKQNHLKNERRKSI